MIDLDRPINCWVHRLYADRDDDDCRNRVIQVIIYPSVATLQAAANRYAKRKDGARAATFNDAAGIFNPAPFRAKYDRRKRKWIDTTTPFAGVMRLAPEIIAHECTHAALHIARLHDWSKPGNNGEANFGSGCDAHEEAFAYLHGALVAEVLGIVQRIEAHGAVVDQ